MFTGIVEEIGTVRARRGGGRYQELVIDASRVLEGTATGDSIAIDGVCQTVTSLDGTTFTVETLDASLTKTTLGSFRPGRRVNLERAVTPTTRMGGHFVQGHVDGVGIVRAVRTENHNVYFSVELSSDLAHYCITEGSIAIDGTSLTIAEMAGSTITINVIPTTWDETVLADRRVGDSVNVEVDVLSRYVERFITNQTRNPAMTEEYLRSLGY